MSRQRIMLVVTAALCMLALPVAWYLISPLFINRAVNEEFPAVVAAPLPAASSTTPPSAPTRMLASSMAAQPAQSTEQPAAAWAAASAGVIQDQSADQMAQPTAGVADTLPSGAAESSAQPPTQPEAEPRLLLSGQFYAVAHRGMGKAAIFELPNGQRVLRFEDFDVLNGPDLYVWLSGATDASSNQAILDGGYFEVARLKGNQGNQNYELPADLDLSQYHSVTIWCRQFGVNFATAPLQ